MSIKTITYCVLLFSLFTINVAAQGLETKIKIYRPDYSGTWKLNESKTKVKYDQGYKSDKVFHLMIIEQNLPAIYITIKVQNNLSNSASYIGEKFTLYTDERGDDYSSLSQNESESSTSKWVNNNLVVTNYLVNKSSENILGTQEFVLSKDGNTLTITYTPNLKRFAEYEDEKKLKEVFVSSYTVYDRVE